VDLTLTAIFVAGASLASLGLLAWLLVEECGRTSSGVVREISRDQ
jgi:hypothetical protein